MASLELHRPPFWRAIRITFEACWKHLSACLLLGAAAAVLTAIPGVLFGLLAPHADLLQLSAQQALTITAFAGAGLLSLALAVFVIYPPTFGGLSLVGAAAVAEEPVNTREVVRRAVDRAIPAIGAFFLAFLMVVGAPLSLGVLAALVRTAVGLGAALPFVVLFVMACGFSVPVMVRCSIAVPIVMVEGCGPREAIRRSWKLMGGAAGWALGVYAVVGFCAAVVSALLGAQLLTGRIVGATDFVVAAIRNAVAIIISVSLLGVATGVVYAAREVPPDTDEPPDGEEPPKRLPEMIPVPIPLHAFDPPVR